MYPGGFQLHTLFVFKIKKNHEAGLDSKQGMRRSLRLIFGDQTFPLKGRTSQAQIFRYQEQNVLNGWGRPAQRTPHRGLVNAMFGSSSSYPKSG
jgi:hypothetical protein